MDWTRVKRRFSGPQGGLSPTEPTAERTSYGAATVTATEPGWGGSRDSIAVQSSSSAVKMAIPGREQWVHGDVENQQNGPQMMLQ